jgi:hypothetical protein
MIDIKLYRIDHLLVLFLYSLCFSSFSYPCRLCSSYLFSLDYSLQDLG